MRRAALFAVALCACADEAGPYDGATVLALMKERGDARGTFHTGSWASELEQIDCDCPDIPVDILMGTVSLPTCELLAPSTTAQAVEADGVLRLAYPVGSPITASASIDLVGPIDGDGAVRLGAVSTLSAAILSAHSIIRLDGTIDDADPPLDPLRPQAELDAELVGRFIATVGDENIDCIARHHLHATMPYQGPLFPK